MNIPTRLFSSNKSLLAFLIVICGFLLASCESDPILSPQSEEEEDKGSYATSNLFGGKTDKNQGHRANPELF
jgi:hypothetical protein